MDQAIPLLIGVGGAGNNIIENLISGHMQVSFDIAIVNTDAQSLARSSVSLKLPIGMGITKGLGSGTKPAIGKLAAEESSQDLAQLFAGRSVIALVGGLGGGTGSGAMPVMASIAKRMGATVFAAVTTPFSYEGRRAEISSKALSLVKESCDATFEFSNESLMSLTGDQTTVGDAFYLASSIINTAIFNAIHRVSPNQSAAPADIDKFGSDTASKIRSMLRSWQDELSQSTFLSPERRESFLITLSDSAALAQLARNADYIHHISPRRFEELIYALYRAAGLEAQLTGATRDHGADLLVWTPGSLFGERFLTVVQLKKISPPAKVGEGAIRDLMGAQMYFNAHKAECLTTSDFTTPAKEVARALHIDLAAYQDLCSKIDSICRR
ncbi:MAG: restriction endonuclease [Gallionella sp.]|nr:restriction endonuclease [Gallionella sp.]